MTGKFFSSTSSAFKFTRLPFNAPLATVLFIKPYSLAVDAEIAT